MSYDNPPPPPPPQYGAPMPGAVPGTNRRRSGPSSPASLGFLCCGLFIGIAAIILGQARQEGDRDVSGEGGGGMATAGVVLGVIALSGW